MVEFNKPDGRRVAIDEKYIISVIENEREDTAVKGMCTIILSTGNTIGVTNDYNSICLSVGENGLIKSEYYKHYTVDDESLPVIPLVDIYRRKHAWTHLVHGIENARKEYLLLKKRLSSNKCSIEVEKSIVERMDFLSKVVKIVSLGDLIRYVRDNGCTKLRDIEGVGAASVHMMHDVFDEYGFDKRGYRKHE